MRKIRNRKQRHAGAKPAACNILPSLYWPKEGKQGHPEFPEFFCPWNSGRFLGIFFRFEFYFLSSLIVQYHVNVIFIEFSFQTVNYTSVKAVNSTVLLQYYSINYLQRSFSYFVCDVRRQTLHKFVCGDGSRRDIMVSDAKFCLNDSFCYPWDENLGRNFDGFRGFLFPPPSPIGIKCVRVEGLLTSSSTPNFTWIGWSTLWTVLWTNIKWRWRVTSGP